MSSASVQVLCPNGRRCTVKVNGDTTMLHVLEEACTRQKFDPTLYNLKYQRSIVDLSLPYRFSNMPNNAKLEVVEADKRRSTDSQVALAVQLEDGTRKQGTFPSTSTLWSVLSELGIAAGQDEAKEPIIVFMRREVCGKGSLEQSTLSSLGVTGGTAVLRLLFRQVNKSCGDPCVQRNVPTTSSHASSLAAAGQEAQGQGGMDVECTDQRREKDGVEDTNQAPNLAGNLTSTEAGSQEVHQTTSQITFPDGSRETSLQSSAAVDEMEVDYPRTGEVPGEEGPMFPSHPFKIFPDDEVVLPREPVPTKRRRPENEVAMVTHEAGHEHTLAYMYERAYALNELATPHTNIPQQDAATKNRGGPAMVPVTVPVVASVVEPCDREAAVMRRDDLALQGSAAVTELPDDFFEVTIDDVKLMQSDLKKQIEKADLPLQTEAMRKARQARLMEQYKKAVVRVCFPDLWILQGSFRPGESLKALVKFVRDSLADPTINFYLYTSPPKTVLKSGKVTFLEAGFVPSATVYVGSESTWLPSLSSQCLSLWKGRKSEDTKPVDAEDIKPVDAEDTKPVDATSSFF